MTLPKPIWSGRDEMGTGLTREAIYVSPRARRCVVESYSIWAKRDGTHQGTCYTLITDESELAELAGDYEEVAEALEKCGLLIPEKL